MYPFSTIIKIYNLNVEHVVYVSSCNFILVLFYYFQLDFLLDFCSFDFMRILNLNLLFFTHRVRRTIQDNYDNE